MSVYTTLSRQEMQVILGQYRIGELKDFQGIAAGIENSNYFVHTDQGRFVLTIFERMAADDLPYFMRLMKHLADQGFVSPAVQLRSGASLIFEHGGKQGCIVSCLPGKTLETLSETQLEQAGGMLARLHEAGLSFPERRANPTYLDWMQETAGAMAADVAARYGQDAADLLTDELGWQQESLPAHLPSGVIHADYFCDNILFSGDDVTGVIDFYYACDGPFAYDLAIAANALAIRLEDGDEIRLERFVAGYSRVRGLSDAEQAAFPALLRLAALRFWISRMFDELYPREGEMVQVKNPEEYRQKLLWCRKGG